MITAIRPITQTVLQFDLRELLAVYQTLQEADKRNGTGFAKDQKDYIEAHYVDVIL